jgi:multisubunit Na+/H+ antiporter MnhB subunit
MVEIKMDLVTVLLIVVFIVMIILFAIGLKYPRGRSDWPLDRNATASIFISVLVFVLLLILSFFASQHVDWPSSVQLFYYAAAVIFGVLIVIAILLPKGLSLEDRR